MNHILEYPFQNLEQTFGISHIEGFPSFRYTFLTTNNLILHPLKTDSYQEWVKVRTDNKVRLQPFEPKWADNWNTEDSYESRIAYQHKEWQEDRGYSFLIIKRQGNILIGGIGVNNIIRGSAQFSSLSYWIDGSHEGKGLMSEALNAIIAFSFNVLNLQRLNAATLKDNEKSQNILERFHFEKEGFSKKYAEINGTRQDHNLYGLNAVKY